MSHEHKFGLVYSDKLNSLGGAQRSTTNLLKFDRPGIDDKPWVYIGLDFPPDPLHVHQTIITDANIVPILRAKVPDRDSIRRVREGLTKYDVGHLLLTHPHSYEWALIHALPRQVRPPYSCIWRGEIETVLESIQRGRHLSNKGKVRRCMSRFMQARIAINADTNLAISPTVYRSLAQLGVPKEKIAIIPNQVGGEMSGKKRVEEGMTHRRKYLEDNQFGVLVASRISPEKNLGWVIEVLRLLGKARLSEPVGFDRHIKIVLAGSSSNDILNKGVLDQFMQAHQEIKDIVGGNKVSFEYIGELSKPALEEYMNAFDVLCAPSSTEGFPRVVIEAMQCGMTVLVNSACTAATDIIKDAIYDTGKKVGCIAKSPAEMSAIILTLVNHPEELQSLQTAAYTWATEKFTQEKAKECFWRVMNKYI